jgi:hypothetical protein
MLRWERNHAASWMWTSESTYLLTTWVNRGLANAPTGVNRAYSPLRLATRPNAAPVYPPLDFSPLWAAFLVLPSALRICLWEAC